METTFQCKLADLITMAEDLYKNNDISKSQFQNVVADLTNDLKLKFIKDVISSASLRDRLLLFIKAFYHETSHCTSSSFNHISDAKGIVSIKSILTNDSERQLIHTAKSDIELVSTQQTQASSNVINNQGFSSTQEFSQLSSEFLGKMDIENFELNLIEMDRSHSIPFTNKVLKSTAFFSSLQFDQAKLNNFLGALEKKYQKHNNPYHNYTHAMTVMHSCYILGKMKQSRQLLTDFDHFILVFSGLCHDVGHTGFNNDFQIKTLSKKALKWNDKSVLENYHAATSIKLLLKPESNFLSGIKKADFVYLRKMLISNILATDMKGHHSQLNSFEAKLRSEQGLVKTQADVQLLSAFIMHASDFGGTVKKFDVMMQWAYRCNQQFGNQYRQQKLRGVARTSFMKDLDIDKVKGMKSQMGFMNGIVRPIYKLLRQYEKEQEPARRMLENIDQSIQTLKNRLEESQKGEEPKHQKQV